MEITEVSYGELKSHIGHDIDLFWSGDRSNPDTMHIVCITCDKTLVSRRIPVDRDKQAQEISRWLAMVCKTYPRVEIHQPGQAWLFWDRDQMDDDIKTNVGRVSKLMPPGIGMVGGGLNDDEATVIVYFDDQLWQEIVSDPR